MTTRRKRGKNGCRTSPPETVSVAARRPIIINPSRCGSFSRPIASQLWSLSAFLYGAFHDGDDFLVPGGLQSPLLIVTLCTCSRPNTLIQTVPYPSHGRRHTAINHSPMLQAPILRVARRFTVFLVSRPRRSFL